MSRSVHVEVTVNGESREADVTVTAKFANRRTSGTPIEPRCYAGAIAAAAEQAAGGTEPPGDLNATPEYKRHLARVLTRGALEEAAGL